MGMVGFCVCVRLPHPHVILAGTAPLFAAPQLSGYIGKIASFAEAT
jgi:hypothetical protein